jgi:hypothetical protein
VSTAVLAPTVIVIVALPPPGAGIVLGLKLTVVPVGAPVADRLIALLKPPLTVVVIVEVPALPSATLRAIGDAEIVKAFLCPGPGGRAAGVRKATICMIHGPGEERGAVAL